MPERQAIFPAGHVRTISGTNLYGKEITVAVGDRVKFKRADGRICLDTVRTGFWSFVLVAPYAPNYSEPAVVLTAHSWTRLGDIMAVNPKEDRDAT